LILSIVLLPGCSSGTEGEKCKSNSDCGICNTCSAGVCVKAIGDCCGDKNCGKSENECTCPKDCGKCESNLSYIKKECSKEKKCISSINSGSLEKDSQVIPMQIGDNTLSLVVSYDKPFLLGS
jgi:hypothetical protein